MKKVLKYLAIGFAWGCTLTTIIEIIQAICINGEMNILTAEYLKHTICGIISGIGFVVPTMIYENEKISKKLQVFIHLAIGFTVYIGAALYAGWLPFELGIGYVITSIVFSILISLIIWFCFYLYYRAKAKKMNELLKNK